MNTLLEKCREYLRAQTDAHAVVKRPPPLAITVSRQTGAGVLTICRHLVDYLEKHRPDPVCNWTVFEQNLIEKVLEDHLLPKSFEKYMPEDARNPWRETLEEMQGLHPNSSLLVQQTWETIFDLAKAGNVILIGRGSNLVTSRLNHVFHVRLIAPVQQRVSHIQSYYKFDHTEAEILVRESDKSHQRYLAKNFNSSMNNPLEYHLTINTGRMGYKEVAEVIGYSAMRHV